LDALLGWTVSIFKKKNAEEVVSFAPRGWSRPWPPHGWRRGLHSWAASRL